MGNKDKRMAINHVIRGAKPDLLCFQETKIQIMSDSLVAEVWGARTSAWLVLLAMGASRGILLIWDINKVEVLDSEVGAYSMSVRCRLRSCVEEWVFVGVYDPTKRWEVDDFLTELDDSKGRWIFLGVSEGILTWLESLDSRKVLGGGT